MNGSTKERDTKSMAKRKMLVDIGRLSDAVSKKLDGLHPDRSKLISNRIVGYVLRHVIDGGDLTEPVVNQLYEVVNYLIDSNIEIPERYK